ncbi:MAG: hypothetical protein ACXWWQ_03760, partial [Candidatus Limnocylindria bacterium]
ARAVGAEHRPWLEGDAEGWFRRAVSQRDPLYAWVADLEVDTRTGTGAPEEVAASIVAALPSAT